MVRSSKPRPRDSSKTYTGMEQPADNEKKELALADLWPKDLPVRFGPEQK